MLLLLLARLLVREFVLVALPVQMVHLFLVVDGPVFY